MSSLLFKQLFFKFTFRLIFKVERLFSLMKSRKIANFILKFTDLSNVEIENPLIFTVSVSKLNLQIYFL